MKKSRYGFKIINGRIKVYVDGYVMISFNQINFEGYYAFKDDSNLYGLDIYLSKGVIIETSYKTKEVWLGILKLLDENL